MGKLFQVEGPDGRVLGWFDARACWCTRRANGVKVDRSAPRAVLALLTPLQKKTLRTAQLAGRRQDVR